MIQPGIELTPGPWLETGNRMAVGEYETGYSIYGKGTLITVGRFTGVLFHILRTVVRASTMGDTSMPMLPSQRHRDTETDRDRDTGTGSFWL